MERLDTKKWLVVYTKSRGEKKLLDRLTARGIQSYCPMQKTLRQWSDRKKIVTIPIIKSYVFVRVHELERTIVLQDPLAVRFLYWLGKPAVIKDQDMRSLQSFLNSNTKVQLETTRPEPGDKVAIAEGPFKGATALVTDIRGGKLRLSLPQIGFRLVSELPVIESESC